ncbi:MAG: phosphatase PAP2 family protein [Planctomycetes bacterium]|nr:phosphatase PAP2 family protein [Planctomycetota bacterium]
MRVVASSAVAGLYALTLRYDVALMDWRYETFPDGPRGTFKQILQGLREFGQFLAILVAIIIVLRCDRRRWTIVACILIAQFLAGLCYNVGKLTIARYRPYAAIDQAVAQAPRPVPGEEQAVHGRSALAVRETWIGWSPNNVNNDTQSFPSGHSAAAFAFAGVLAWFYPRLRLLFWALACGCAASRYMDAVHWLSDCVAGAAIGYAGAWLALRAVTAWRR